MTDRSRPSLPLGSRRPKRSRTPQAPAATKTTPPPPKSEAKPGPPVPPVEPVSRSLPPQNQNQNQNQNKVVSFQGHQRRKKLHLPKLAPSPLTMVGSPRNKRQRSRIPWPLLYTIRLLILGVGIGAIMGTSLSMIVPSADSNHGSKSTAKATKNQTNGVDNVDPQLVALTPTQELTPLKGDFQTIAKGYTQLQGSVYLWDLNTNNFVNFGGEKVFSAASVIKIPILIAFFQEVDAERLKLDETMVMEKSLIAGGSGTMQYQKPGTSFSAMEVATRMIIESDNTATNMLIQRLGGIAALNQRWTEWGLSQTKLNNILPDLEGTNTTSTKELVQMLASLDQGHLVSARSRDRIFYIMERTKTRTLLPQGIGPDARIVHKTGDIGTMIGDAGIIDLPNGRRYAMAALVNRPFNDVKAREMIQRFSERAYQYLMNPPQTNTTPKENPPKPSNNPT